MLRSFVFSLCIAGAAVLAEQADYNYGDDYNDGGDDDAAAAAQAYYYDNLENNGDFSAGDDTITYWTDYAILPKRCIV